MPTTKTVKKNTESTLKSKMSKVTAKEDAGTMLRIRVMAYDSKVLDASVKQIIETAMRHDVKVIGPVPLPTQIKKYTVNRASFVYKNAREQFEMRILLLMD